jgi:hypothetical protein
MVAAEVHGRLQVTMRCRTDTQAIQPNGLHALGLISPSDALNAKIDFLSRGWLHFDLKWLEVECVPQATRLTIQDASRYDSIGDLISSLLVSEKDPPPVSDVKQITVWRSGHFLATETTAASRRLLTMVDHSWLTGSHAPEGLTALGWALPVSDSGASEAAVVAKPSDREGCWLSVASSLEWYFNEDIAQGKKLSEITVEQVFADWPKYVELVDRRVREFAALIQERVGASIVQTPVGGRKTDDGTR